MSSAGPGAIEMVARRVHEADAGLDDHVIEVAIEAVLTHPAVLRELVRALEPGAGPLQLGAPPVVGRLVVELRSRGSALPEPTCVRCGRTACPLTASHEGGVCKRCRNRQRATACVTCGVVKPVAGRDGSGGALCSVCVPRPKRRCARCGEVAVIARRAEGGHGDLCVDCYKGPSAVCRVCGRTKVCNFVSQGRPICFSCSPRRTMACAHCAEQRPPCVRWPEGPVCEPCYRAALARRGTCTDCRIERRLVAPPGPEATRCADCAGVAGLARCTACGAEERPYRHGLCVRCALGEQIAELVGTGVGPLAPVCDTLLAAPQPYSAYNWLRSGASAAILADIASGALPLTHEALDNHAESRAANYLRQILVAHGALAARDDAIVRLEAWVEARLDGVSSGPERALLRSYGTWWVLRRARQRAGTSRRPRTPTARAKSSLNAAIAFLSFLDERHTDLASCSQSDVEAWVTEGPPSAPEISDFVAWATQHKLMINVGVPGRRRHDGPALGDEARWEMVQRLLHDDTLEVADRVAGCLVLLYGQQLSRVVAITRDQVTHHDGAVHLHLGTTYIELPEPLAALFVQLARSRRTKNSVAATLPSPWLFPGLDPGRPLTASHLGQRLRNLGIATMSARRSALMHLARHLPASVLADLLGITPNTAVRWVGAAGGDWNAYAAQLISDGNRGL